MVYHFDNATQVLEGKAMIVCAEPQNCVELYEAIINRPGHSDDDDKHNKVIMTGSSSDALNMAHIRNKPRRKAIGDRLKKSKRLFEIGDCSGVACRFDAPCFFVWTSQCVVTT